MPQCPARIFAYELSSSTLLRYYHDIRSSVRLSPIPLRRLCDKVRWEPGQLDGRETNRLDYGKTCKKGGIVCAAKRDSD